jgi:hypothetical protein
MSTPFLSFTSTMKPIGTFSDSMIPVLAASFAFRRLHLCRLHGPLPRMKKMRIEVEGEEGDQEEEGGGQGSPALPSARARRSASRSRGRRRSGRGPRWLRAVVHRRRSWQSCRPRTPHAHGSPRFGLSCSNSICVTSLKLTFAAARRRAPGSRAGASVAAPGASASSGPCSRASRSDRSTTSSSGTTSLALSRSSI